MQSATKNFGWAVAYISGILFLTGVFGAIYSAAGVAVGLLAAAAAIAALIKPDDSIGLGHRGVVTTLLLIALFRAWTMFGADEEENLRREAHMADLKAQNPAQYLVELKKGDPENWMTELEKLDPARHQAELKRIDDELAAERAEAIAQRDAKWARNKAKLAAEKAEVHEERCRSRTVRIHAYNAAQQFIAAQLKSPSTADFPGSSKVTISPFGECSFKINGYVDAQNGFGAMIRSQYVAEITRYGEHGWQFGGAEFL